MCHGDWFTWWDSNSNTFKLNEKRYFLREVNITRWVTQLCNSNVVTKVYSLTERHNGERRINSISYTQKHRIRVIELLLIPMLMKIIKTS